MIKVYSPAAIDLWIILLGGKVASYGESVTRSASIGTAKVFKMQVDRAQSGSHLRLYYKSIETETKDC